MATTTNYSWTTPDDTALVKDGAAAIRSLGTAIDTTVFTNAGAAIAKTIVDAKGDIIAATAADTVARLAVGANGTVLTAASGQATGLEWAAPASGGMTLISTTTLSGASITLSSIPATYNSLRLVVRNVDNDTDGRVLYFRFNADATANRHADLTTGANTGSFGNAFATFGADLDDVAVTNLFIADFPDYANAVTWKIANVYGINPDSTTATNWRARNALSMYNQTTAISSISIFPSSGNFSAGTALLYGVK